VGDDRAGGARIDAALLAVTPKIGNLTPRLSAGRDGFR
jgi:hypothetical protein